MIIAEQSIQKPTLLKTQFYDAIKCLSIKMTTFQQHDIVLKLSNKHWRF